MAKRFFLILISIFAAVIALKTLFKFVVEKPLPVIAITQIIEHNTLDTVREGVLKRFEEKGYIDGQSFRLVYQNAHGQLTTAAQITQHFASLKPAVLVALSTQSAQLLQNLSLQQKIPLIFTAVTDPVAAKLVPDLEKPSPGVTGISDYMPPQPQLTMIKSFLPHLKTLGVLYNPSEVNSTAYLETFEKSARAQGITIIRSPLNNTSEAIAATKNLVGTSVDAIYFPNDNTAMASVPAIVGVAHGKGIPVFANDSASVEQGALAAVAYDRTQMGRDTADRVIEALNKGYSFAQPVKVGSAIVTVVNESSLKQLELTLPLASSSFVLVKKDKTGT